MENEMKDDKEFSELQLRATIIPQQVRWPAPEYVHWQKLHAVADEARDSVAKAWAAFDAIDKDVDLSAEGKARQKKKVAATAIAEFEQSKTLLGARDAVARQVEKWTEKTGLVLKMPANIVEAVIQSEIRAHLAAMKGGKLGFLEKHATDPVVAAAILGAPGFLSGLTDTELTFVKQNVEQHMAPEVTKARDATLKAMKEAEAGCQNAIHKIGERAGLSKAPDGTWRDHSDSEALMGRRGRSR